MLEARSRSPATQTVPFIVVRELIAIWREQGEKRFSIDWIQDTVLHDTT